jgi:hypothetical protein
MRVIRVIMYESDDQTKLDHQLSKSLQDGQYNLATTITVATVEEVRGDRFDYLMTYLNKASEIKQSLYQAVTVRSTGR